MKEKIFKGFIVLLTIATLIMSNFIFVATGLVYAVYEELESQAVNTSNGQVEFDAYFKDAQGNKTHSINRNIKDGLQMYINVRVKDAGVLKDAIIKLSNPNFAIENVEHSYIKEIKSQTNEICLNQIVYGNNVEIEVPVKFEKVDFINAEEFNKETTISLSGKYKGNDEKEKEVTGEIRTRVAWTEEIDTTVEQKIEKYLNVGDKLMLQTNITSQINENALPKDTEEIVTNIIKVNEIEPEDIKVVLNGTKLEKNLYTIDEETRTIKVRTRNQENAEQKINWTDTKDEYKIIYTYPKEADLENTKVSIKTKVTTNAYTKETIEKEIQREVELSKQGTIVTLTNKATEKIYKGYMYAQVENETTYEEVLTAEVSDAKNTQEVTIEKETEHFINNKGENISTNESIVYKQTKINKEEMLQKLGQDGTIQIYNNNQLLQTINRDTLADENGNIVITYGTEIRDVKLVISKPKEEGTINIYNTKAIKGNTGYNKQQLKELQTLESTVKLTNNQDTSKTVENIALVETRTEAKLEINNVNLSTLQENENIQIVATLKTNNNEYDLYKNPKIRIEFPEEVEEIQVDSINKLFSEELEIEKAVLFEENGRKVIEAQFKGEQTKFSDDISEGIQFIINANIKVKKETPTKKATINMIYTNENGAEKQYEQNVEINLVSKYGVLVYQKLANYNDEEETIETFDENISLGNLNVASSTKEAKAKAIIINNYPNSLDNVEIIGKIPAIQEETIGEQQLKSTIELQIKEVKTNKQNAQILYSKDGIEWTDSIEGAKQYKIILENNKLEVQEELEIEYSFIIPENIKLNDTTYTALTLSYLFNGQKMDTKSVIKLSTYAVNPLEEGQQGVSKTENIGNIQIDMRAVTGKNELKDGEQVNEGQAIRYEVTVTNNKGEDLNNFSLIAKHTNAVFYGEVKKEAIAVDEGAEPYNIFIEELPELEQKEFIEEIIKAGESKTFIYEFVPTIESIDNTITGEITIKADNLEERKINTITNTIKETNLKLTLKNQLSETTNITTNGNIKVLLKVKNISSQEQKEIITSLNLEDYMGIDTNRSDEGDKYELVDAENNIVKFKIYSIQPDEEIDIPVFIRIGSIDLNLVSKDMSLIFTASTGSDTYVSNELKKTVIQTEGAVEINQVSDRTENDVKDGDIIKFTTTIKNTGVIAQDNVIIKSQIQYGLEVQKAYITYNGQKKEINIENNVISEKTDFNVGDVIILEFEIKVNENKIIGYKISSITSITAFGKTTQSNEIVYNLKVPEQIPDLPDMPDIPSEPDNPDQPDTPDIPDTPDQPDTPDNPDQPDNPGITEKTYKITGTIWEDKNRNGLREDKEEALSNINVFLINSKTEKYVVDKNGKRYEVTTSNNGKYEFEGIAEGEYMVVFEYDLTKYRLTSYRKEGIAENQNSDFINKNIKIENESKNVAISDIIKIQNADEINIDAGLIENEVFDMSLEKYVSRITLQNKQGTIVKEYNKTQLAKLEIDAKQISGSTVLIEYTINVTNEGEIDGYVNEIVDYMPNDLRFISEINKQWYTSTDNTLHTVAFTNEKIAPGETKTITLTLVKTMTQNNTGIVVNTAEIAKQSNDLNLQDIDSIAGNRKEGEDDISTAEVVLSIRTGGTTIIIGIVTTVVLLVITGIVIYILRRKEVNHE